MEIGYYSNKSRDFLYWNGGYFVNESAMIFTKHEVGEVKALTLYVPPKPKSREFYVSNAGIVCVANGKEIRDADTFDRMDETVVFKYREPKRSGHYQKDGKIYYHDGRLILMGEDGQRIPVRRLRSEGFFVYKGFEKELHYGDIMINLLGRKVIYTQSGYIDCETGHVSNVYVPFVEG